MNTLSKSSQNPYVGPRPFKTHETLYGRDWERENLLDLLIAERLVMLYSPSGAGKSSLIQAALIPDLEKEGFTVLPVIRVGQEPPLLTENRYVLSTLLSLEQRPDMPEKERIPPKALAKLDLAGYFEERQAALKDKHTVFIFDQFEEILTVDPTDQPIKENFFKEIGEVLRDRNYWALFALREDRIAGLDPFLGLIPTRLKTTFRLNFLEEKAASEAIQKPAKDHHINFTEDAAKKLIKDLQTEQIQQLDGSFVDKTGLYIEPVQLQVVCRRLWETLPADAKSIEADAIEAVGTVDQALIDYYNEKIIAIVAETKVSEREIRDWCDKQLITSQGIRSQVQSGQNQGLENRVINTLIHAHLVRSENRNNINWYELAHDRLIKPIQKANTKWRDDHLSLLQHQTARWDKEGRSDGLLLRGAELKKAKCWADGNPNLTPSEQDFMARCQKIQTQTLYKRSLICLAMTFGILATVIAIYAVFLYNEAKKQESFATAEFAKSIVSTDQILGLVAAINAVQLSLSRQAWFHWFPWFPRDDSLKRVRSDFLSVIKDVREFDFLSGNGIPISEIALDTNARTVIIQYKNGKLQLWSRQKVEEKEFLTKYNNQATAVAISVDGQAMVSKTENDWQLWSRSNNPTRISLSMTLSLHDDHKIAISRDGKNVVSGGEDATVKLWSLDDNNKIIEKYFRNLSGAKISAIAISADGQIVVSGGEDSSMQLWSHNGPQGNLFFQRDGSISINDEESIVRGIRSISISDDGKIIASVGNNFVQLWSSVGDEIDRRFHRGVNSVAISADGQTVVSGSDNNDLRLWSRYDEQLSKTRLSLPHKKTTAVSISSNGKIVASGDEHGEIKLWSRDSLDAGKLIANTSNYTNNELVEDCKSWLEVACGRLRGHSIWEKPNKTDTEQGAVETCRVHFPEQMK